MNPLALYAEQIRFARSRTNTLLAGIPQECWFWMPTPAVTHVAWQVGHLAVAENLLIFRLVFGEDAKGDSLLAPEFIKLFKRDSVPNTDAKIYPSAKEIRSAFDAVHERVLKELPRFDPQLLKEPPYLEHSLCKTREEVLMWCSHHEATHTGQIGLLRRLMGEPHVW